MLLLKELLLYTLMYHITTTRATTGGADASSVITECFNIDPFFPPPRRLSCYRTNIRQIGPFQTCEASFVRTQRIAVASQSENFTIMFVHTPGRLRGRLYNNRLLCRWNIECPPNQLMYLDINEHIIEPKANTSFFSEPVCVDYMKSFRDFGTQTTCGTLDPYADLEPNRMFMEFRSNRRIRFPGFKVHVVCFSPNLQDVEGCTATPIDQLFPSVGRRKRSTKTKARVVMDVANSEELMEQFIEAVTQCTEQSGQLRSKRASNITRLTVAPDLLVYYITQSRLVVVIEGGRVVNSFRGITTLHTYNQFDGVQSYNHASEPLERFRGNGIISIINDTCYYFIFGVDPRFTPTEEEQWVIRSWLDAEEVLVIKSDFIIEEQQDSHTLRTTYRPPGYYRWSPGSPRSHESSSSSTSSSHRSSSSSSYTSAHSRPQSSSHTSPRKSSHTSSLSTSSSETSGKKSRASKSKSRKRGRRQASPTIAPTITDAAVLSANSCNAIVRAVAQSIISLSGNN